MFRSGLCSHDMGTVTTVPAEQVLFALSRVHTTALLTLVRRANVLKVYSYSDVSAVKMGWLPRVWQRTFIGMWWTFIVRITKCFGSKRVWVAILWKSSLCHGENGWCIDIYCSFSMPSFVGKHNILFARKADMLIKKIIVHILSSHKGYVRDM